MKGMIRKVFKSKGSSSSVRTDLLRKSSGWFSLFTEWSRKCSGGFSLFTGRLCNRLRQLNDDPKRDIQPGSIQSTSKRVVLAISMIILIVSVFVVSVFATGPGSNEDPVALKSYVDAKISDLETRLGVSPQSKGSSATQGQSTAGGNQTGGADATVDATTAAKLDELSKRIDALAAENAELRRRLGGSGEGVAGDGVGNDYTSDQNATNGANGATDGANGDGFGGLQGVIPGSSTFQVYEIRGGQRILLGAGTEVVIRTGRASAIVGEFGGVVNLITGENYGAGDNTAINNLLLSARNDGRGLRFNADSYVLIKGEFEVR